VIRRSILCGAVDELLFIVKNDKDHKNEIEYKENI
jgi:hypothetical protein